MCSYLLMLKVLVSPAQLLTFILCCIPDRNILSNRVVIALLHFILQSQQHNFYDKTGA